jgi:FtsH-binding integral membrane protein
VPQVLAIGMLLWAFNPDNPYVYYILLRWICCGVFAYLAVQSWERHKKGWVWILGIAALIYNPIIRVYLTRGIWQVVNVITISVAVSSIYVLKKETT